MPFTGIADPEAVSRLREVVKCHCRNNHITDNLEREQVAFRVMSLFNGGMTNMEDLMKALSDGENHSTG